MKKVINGKLYNTETAQEICNYCSPGNWGDFSHFEETLYLKRSGECFLHGEGGPMTRYSQACGLNEWQGGEKIIPLTDSEAREWLEKYGEVEDYEKIFGKVSEGKTETIHFRCSPEEAEAIKTAAAESGETISAYLIRKALKN